MNFVTSDGKALTNGFATRSSKQTKKHQCPILPKVGLRSDTPLFFEVKTMLAYLWVRSDTNLGYNKNYNFLMILSQKKGQKTVHIIAVF